MMKQYVLKRFFLLLPTFLGITGLTFFMLQLAPGDPAALKAQSFTELLADPQQTEAVVTETQKLYGLEKPLSLQYLLWLKRIVLFDFGESYRDHRPVMAKIAEALPITLLLNALTLLVIFVIAFPLGAYNALKPNSFHDRVSALFLFLLYSLPSFWFALLLIVLFAGGDYLNLFPLIGIFSDGRETPLVWTYWESLVASHPPGHRIKCGEYRFSFAICSRFFSRGDEKRIHPNCLCKRALALSGHGETCIQKCASSLGHVVWESSSRSFEWKRDCGTDFFDSRNGPSQF